MTTLRALANLVTGLYLPHGARSGYLSREIPHEYLDRSIRITREGNGVYRLEITGESRAWTLFSRRRAPRGDAV
ncbi:MAG TPA: hypothetical protein VFB58_06835 [Chloroflexota bacterium]|nr:hypothetical protein [Chloroflexota bacterium]